MAAAEQRHSPWQQHRRCRLQPDPCPHDCEEAHCSSRRRQEEQSRVGPSRGRREGGVQAREGEGGAAAGTAFRGSEPRASRPHRFWVWPLTAGEGVSQGIRSRERMPSWNFLTRDCASAGRRRPGHCRLPCGDCRRVPVTVWGTGSLRGGAAQPPERVTRMHEWGLSVRGRCARQGESIQKACD